MASRSWTQMRAKCADEGRCRWCLRPCKPDPAHIIARAHARPGVDHGEHPDNCVPLCREHHSLYDLRELDISAVLTAEEMAHAVILAGSLITALERITGAKWSPRS